MKKTLIVALGVCIAAFASKAQGGDVLTSGRIVRDPVNAAMAGSDFVSSDNLAYSWQGNAASLPFGSHKLDAAAAYGSWAPKALSSTNYAFGAASSFGSFGVSAGFVTDRMEAISDLYGYDKFVPSNMQIALGAGYRIGERLGLGVSAMYLKEQILSDVGYSGLNLSANVLYRVSPNFDATAGVANLGSKVKSRAGTAFSQPASARLGLQYRIWSLKANLGADYFFSGNYSAAVGAEYGIADIVFLRAGYRYSSEYAVIPSHLSVGAGLQFKGVHLDFSYLTAGDVLAGTMLAGLGFRF